MKNHRTDRYSISLLGLLLLLVHLSAAANEERSPLVLASAMASQTMQRFPDPWLLRESDGAYRWSYTIGLVLYGMEKLHQQTGDSALLDYIQRYADHYIDADGNIGTLDVAEFNIDSINSGKLLFALHERKGDARYRYAMDELREQLQWQPRTHSGGFWHKLKYPWQVWLDGLYMAQPFYAQYEKSFGTEAAVFDDIVSQFAVIRDKTLDPHTGLLYHAWDESRLQPWANEDTGQSPGFWSRAMGWYAMAIVDTLEFLPTGHPGHQQLRSILTDLTDALILFQHESGLWYQVTDQGAREGNWLEASGTAMFVYSIAKGVRLGVLDAAYARIARKGYEGMVSQLISTDPDGTLHLNDICRSAGLGGVPYRDGTFEYYVSTDRVSDDAHGVGAFLLASAEMSRLQL
jgi:unsaturated rhamnogalacturonyl hydrolase